MLFNSLTFGVFFPVVFCLYWTLAERGRQNLFLLLSSYLFYAWWDYRFLGLILFQSLFDYGIALALERSVGAVRRRRLLTLTLSVNLCLLGFFKYANFFQDSLLAAAHAAGWNLAAHPLSIVLPVGISFYTFQTMSYTISVYRGTIPACHNLLDYLAYVAFFPQLVAGPIERPVHLLPQFQQPRAFDSSQAVEGCRLILWGLFKKMVVADSLAVIVDASYRSIPSASGTELAFATFCFAFQIYGDFSGYSDIALGTARLLGFDLMRNFAYPYFATSLQDFWRRWHISLSTWFRDYLYIPLGGSRQHRARNLLITFLVSGLWHGAAWTFVIWGALNGLGLLLEIAFRGHLKGSPPGLLRQGLGMATTFPFICLCWVFFRSPDLGSAVTVLQRIGGAIHESQLGSGAWIAGHGDTLAQLVLMLTLEWLRRDQLVPLNFAGPRWGRWSLYTLLIFDILCCGTRAPSSFLYFQF